MDNEGIQIVLAAIVANYGPFTLTEEQLVETKTGVRVSMDEASNTMIVESWDGNDSKDQETE